MEKYIQVVPENILWDCHIRMAFDSLSGQLVYVNMLMNNTSRILIKNGSS